MPKKIEEIKEEIIEEVEESIMESEAKQEFRLLIEKYKLQNPKKYAEKEEALLEKLNEMK
jgi:pyocin large subunit-like protein